MPLSAQPCRHFILKSAISIKFSFADDYVALRLSRTLTAHNFCELLFRPCTLAFLTLLNQMTIVLGSRVTRRIFAMCYGFGFYFIVSSFYKTIQFKVNTKKVDTVKHCYKLPKHFLLLI